MFKAKDMINLATKEFYIKETIDGETYDPFSAETLRVLPSPHPSYRERIIDMSRRKYAMPREEVAQQLRKEEHEMRFGGAIRGAAEAAPRQASDQAAEISSVQISAEAAQPQAAAKTPPEPLI